MRVWALLLRRQLGGAAVAHLGGAGLFVVVVAVEGAALDGPALGARLADTVPRLWAMAAAALALLGAAVATARLRRGGGVLALGSLGVGPGAVVLAAALVGGAVGLGAAAVPPDPAPELRAWVRGEGGWWHAGVAVPDEPGGTVGPPRPTEAPAWRTPAAGAAGAAAGAALGLWAGTLATVGAAGALLVAEALARGLVERAALPEVAAGAPALLAVGLLLLLRLRAPLFPSRWT